jgi:hypothetical protein
MYFEISLRPYRTGSSKFKRFSVPITAGIRATLDGPLSHFSLPLQRNSETVLQWSHYRFLPNSFQFFSYHAIRRCIASILKASVKAPPINTHIHFILRTALLLESHVIHTFVSYSHSQSKDNCAITKWSVRTPVRVYGHTGRQMCHLLQQYTLLSRHLILPKPQVCTAIGQCFQYITKLTSWNWALLDETPPVQLLKNFPAFYGPRRFITVLKIVLHWSLS